MSGNSRKISANGLVASNVLISVAAACALDVHVDSSFVTLSTILFRRKSMSRSWCLMKSAPIIGLVTSATTNGQQKSRRRPKLSLIICSPITLIGEPFAANRRVAVGRSSYDGVDSGKTETSAPVSMRNDLFEMLSWILRRKIFRSFVVDASLISATRVWLHAVVFVLAAVAAAGVVERGRFRR